MFVIIIINKGWEKMTNKIENAIKQNDIRIPEANNSDIAKESLMPLVDLPKPKPADTDNKGE